MHVYLISVPFSPEQIQAMNLGSHDINITWSLPDDAYPTGQPVIYNITARSLDAPQEATNQSVEYMGM